MFYWNHVVVEGYCFAPKGLCGKRVSAFCLGCDGKHCPHFVFSDSNEREAARWVPLRLIVLDRIEVVARDVWDNITWFFWGQLWFNQRKVREFFDNIPVADCPAIDKQAQRLETQFPKWLKKQKEE